MTLAFFPLALVGLPVSNFRLYWVSLVFALLLPAVYAGFLYCQPGGGYRLEWGRSWCSTDRIWCILAWFSSGFSMSCNRF